MSSIKNDRRATITFLDGKVREFEYAHRTARENEPCDVFRTAAGESIEVFHHAIQTIDVVYLDA